MILRKCLLLIVMGLTVFAIACGGPQPDSQRDANSVASQKPAPMANITIKDATAVAGGKAVLEIELDSVDDIGVIVFTLNFDPAVFKYASTSLAPGVPKEAVLSLNDKQTASGKLGVLIDSTKAFEKGRKSIVTATFQIAKDAIAGDYQFTFTSNPAILSVATINAELVNAKFPPGIIHVAAAR